MKVLILNGSPVEKGIIFKLLEEFRKNLTKNHEIDCINLYDLRLNPCIGCMICRGTGRCEIQTDDIQIVSEKIKNADCLVIGTPTHWGNMSASLKILFDRTVPIFIKNKPNGIPIPMQKNKLAVIITACSTPFPFNIIFRQSTSTINAVRNILKLSGYKIVGTSCKSNSLQNRDISNYLCRKLKKIANKLNN